MTNQTKNTWRIPRIVQDVCGHLYVGVVTNRRTVQMYRVTPSDLIGWMRGSEKLETQFSPGKLTNRTWLHGYLLQDSIAAEHAMARTPHTATARRAYMTVHVIGLLFALSGLPVYLMHGLGWRTVLCAVVGFLLWHAVALVIWYAMGVRTGFRREYTMAQQACEQDALSRIKHSMQLPYEVTPVVYWAHGGEWTNGYESEAIDIGTQLLDFGTIELMPRATAFLRSYLEAHPIAQRDIEELVSIVRQVRQWNDVDDAVSVIEQADRDRPGSVTLEQLQLAASLAARLEKKTTELRQKAEESKILLTMSSQEHQNLMAAKDVDAAFQYLKFNKGMLNL